MGDVKQWISVKIQRALGFESVDDVADIVSSIMAKTDARDIESTLRDFLGSDDAAEEIISGYLKKISLPRAVSVRPLLSRLSALYGRNTGFETAPTLLRILLDSFPYLSLKFSQTPVLTIALYCMTPEKMELDVKQPQKPEPSVYTQAAQAAGRSIPREGVHEPMKHEENDFGYGALVKPKKKAGKHKNRDNYQRVEYGADGRLLNTGGITIIKKVKKGARGEGYEDEAIPEFRERAICGCQARLHPFVNNCLRCGRIVCMQEDVGECFYCGHFVTPQGTPQMSPFLTTETPTPNGDETPGDPTKSTAEKDAHAAGLKRAQDNLARLLHFDKTMAERTTVYDDQADYFDMSNRWISAEERARLAKREAELIKSRENASSTIALDFAGRTVVTTVQSSDEAHQRFKEQILADMANEHHKQKIMDREEAEQRHQDEMERIKAHIRHRPDGTVFVLPGLEVPAPEFVTRNSDAKSLAQKPSPASNKKPSSISTATAPDTSSSLESSTSSMPAPRLQPVSRLQTDFFPEVELEPMTDVDDAPTSSTASGHVVNTGKVEDGQSSMKVRGIVEGFRGRVWNADDRMEMIQWMSQQGGNFYMWAPFDDPMHRRLWNHLFSDEDVVNLKTTVAKCTQLGVEFNLALRPHSVDYRSLTHSDALARKILQAYEQCGCRSFSITFADEERSTPSGCRSLASAQTDLVNTLIQVVDEFVKLKSDGTASKDKSTDTTIRWLFCPAMYTASLEPGQEVSTLNYLRELNQQLNPRVELLWSGPSSPAPSIDTVYLARCKRFFGNRSLFFWDRLPQSSPSYDLPKHSADAFDYALQNHQFIEVYDNRSPQLASTFNGALVSTMAAPIPSRVTVGTALQFFGNMKTYDAKKALVPALQRHVMSEKSEPLIAALTSLLSIIPCSPMTKRSRAPPSLNLADAEERGFFNGLKTHLAKLESAPNAFPSRLQFSPSFDLIRELVAMNLSYFDYIRDPKNHAIPITTNIRALRQTLIPVLYTEYDLTQYRTLLFSHPIADKSLKGDVQRTYTKFKAANSISPKDAETKEMCLRLATEATTSMRELESYLIISYTKDDINAWRTFLNLLFFRDASKSFLHKLPPITSPPSPTPNSKILEIRSARIKARLAEEEKYRTVGLKFKIASGMVDPEELPENLASLIASPMPPKAAPSSSAATSSAPAPSSSTNAPKKVRKHEVKDLPVPGMRYIRDFITPEAEAKLMEEIEAKEWDTSLSRRIQQYGFKFLYRVSDPSDWNTERLEAAPAFPQFLRDLGNDIVNGAYVANMPNQSIINEYLPGQGIRHHIDNPLSYEDGIVSVSLGGAVVMEFANEKTGEKASWLLEPRSLLVLTKDSRSVWTHSIAQRKEDVWNGVTMAREKRVSITMRKVKQSVVKSIFDAATKKK